MLAVIIVVITFEVDEETINFLKKAFVILSISAVTNRKKLPSNRHLAYQKNLLPGIFVKSFKFKKYIYCHCQVGKNNGLRLPVLCLR